MNKYTDSPLKDVAVATEVLNEAKENPETYPEVEDSISKELYVKHTDFEVDVDEDEELGISKSDVNFDIFTKNACDTEHLPNFDIFEDDLGLDGENYKAMKKCLYYYQNSIRQDTVPYKINKKTHIDNRSQMLIIAGAGSGKTTIKNQVKRIMKDFNGTDGAIEVSGVSHPEQLVGKNKYEGKGPNKKAIAVPGVLAYRCVLNDEAQDMLNELNDVYAKSQRLKRVAMDAYGLNKITKKLVEDTPEDVFGYFSPVRVCDFAHPKKLDGKFFDTGSFRRYFSFNINVEQELSIDDITNFCFDKSSESQKSWKDTLDELYNKQTNVEFDEENLKIVAYYHKCLLFYLLKHKNQNVFRYGLQTRYSLRDMFCKNLLILSKIKKEKTPSVDTTIEACCDTMLFVLKSIETYNELGNMGATADVWGGCGDQDAQALEYLYVKGAISKETSQISIKKFQTILAQFYGCKVTQSRSHHYRLKKDGFIDSAQIGKYESKVWLRFIPKEIKLSTVSFDPFEFWDSYFQGANVKNTLLAPLKSCYSDDKAFEKSQGDGGVGVLASLLIKNYRCVKVEKNKNKKIIYIESEKAYPPTLSPLSPLKSVDDTATIKPKIKGIKHPKKPLAPLKPKKIKEKTERDTQYWEAKECENIKPCNPEEVIKYIKENPYTDTKQLLEMFGPGVNKLKKDGVI